MCIKINNAINLLKNNNVVYDFSGEKSGQIIQKVEEMLEVKFPNSYNYFLKKLGYFSLGDFAVYGIISDSSKNIKNTGIVYGVLNDRENFAVPHHMINFFDIGNGDSYALDLSQMNEEGECPVVVWPIGGYEATPVLEVVAPDFGKFFLDMVEEQIKRKVEE